MIHTYYFFQFFNILNYRINSRLTAELFRNSSKIPVKSKGLQLKRLFKLISCEFCWILKGTTNNCKNVYLVAMAKCALAMIKIECYLPADYRLNQEVLREESRIDTLYYENQKTKLATLPIMLINFLVRTLLKSTQSLFSLSFFCP